VIEKAVGEVKKGPKRKFVQSIDLAINLKDVDMKKPENRLNEEIVLPEGKGKDVRIAMIAEGDVAHQARDFVDTVITAGELEELAKDKKEAKKLANSHEFFIAQTDLMSTVGRYLGTVLGPRGKMPKPVPPAAPVGPIADRLRKTVRLRTKEQPIIHLSVGREDMNDKAIAENVFTVLQHVERKMEKGLNNFKSVYLKTTMGPSVKVEV
jgi:large subunit ribosomal protein L1